MHLPAALMSFTVANEWLEQRLRRTKGSSECHCNGGDMGVNEDHGLHSRGLVV